MKEQIQKPRSVHGFRIHSEFSESSALGTPTETEKEGHKSR